MAEPGGTIVQVGMFAQAAVDVPAGAMLSKELSYHASFRFHREFAWAIHYIESGLIDIDPILTRTFPMIEASVAFNFARDRNRAMKVHLAI